MSHLEPYAFWDWPLTSGQFQTGLDVQLPGSDLLLSLEDGYLDEPATTVGQDAKHHQKAYLPPLDLGMEDDWNSSDDFFGYHFENDGTDLLPSSPEVVSLDLNTIDFSQIVSQEESIRKPSVCLKLPDEVAGSHDYASAAFVPVLEVSSEELFRTVTENIFNESNHTCEFDPDWLLSQVPVLPPVSLEEVESVLSASRLDTFGSPKAEFSKVECYEPLPEVRYRPAPLHFGETEIENFQLSVNSLSFLLGGSPVLGNPGLVTACPSQVPQDMAWYGGDALVNSPALFSGLMTVENTVSVDAYPASVSPFEASPMSFSATSEDSENDSSTKIIRSANSSVRVEPYPMSLVKPERRERKREQNKTAALKYRQKKRTEQGSSLSECEQLEKRNGELKSRAEELTREINYLKGLISEIYSSQAE